MRLRAERAGDATLAQPVEQLIRNQQVVGSNPTGGSKNTKNVKAFRGHFGGRSVDLSRIVRTMSARFCCKGMNERMRSAEPSVDNAAMG
jgi:hypothetical protein